MRPDHQEFADGVKLVAIAGVAAIFTATLVIGAGRALMPDSPTATAADRGEMIRIVSR